MSWQPLSKRMSGVEPDGPYEGAPEHLRYPLLKWVRERIGLDGRFLADDLLLEIGLRFRLGLPANVDNLGFAMELTRQAELNEDFLIDLVDAILYILYARGMQTTAWEELERTLESGASVWRVDSTPSSLVRIVTDESQATFESATSVADAATKELKEAWANAFGRNGDPSDAWDHAIKAVEDALIPVMMPNNGSATLGSVVGELASQNGAQWRMVLPGKDQDHDVSFLVAMLRLIWPNHDRHGGPVPKRTPTPQEARAVVTLAATIVQWHRDGWVVQRRSGKRP